MGQGSVALGVAPFSLNWDQRTQESGGIRLLIPV